MLIPTEHVYTGVDADVIIYMTAGNKKKGLAGWASTCMLDKNKGYPLAGRLHLETANIENHTFEEIFSTVVHEISHILAFSTNLIEHWTKPNGMLYKKEELIIWNKERGNLVAKLITPKVLQKAREIFGCPDLDGLELETSHNQTMTAH